MEGVQQDHEPPVMAAWSTQSTGETKQKRKSTGSVMDASEAVTASGRMAAAVCFRRSFRL